MQWGGGITRLRNNAFTLIELLAIIVILAIIAVITVPIILNIIENSRKGAATDSAYGYKDSINKYYVSELSNNNKLMLNGTYEVKANGVLNGNFGVTENAEDRTIPIDGTKPSSGKLRYSNNVLNAGCVVIGDYKVTFGTDGKVDGTVKGDCSNYEFPTTSGSETSGGSSTPVAQTWDMYYYNTGSGLGTSDTLDESWDAYVRKNTTLNKYEMCANGVCVEPGGTYGYYNDDSSTNIWTEDEGHLDYGDGNLILCTNGSVFASNSSCMCDSTC